MVKIPRIRTCRYPGCHNPAFIPNHYCSAHIAYEKQLQQKNDFYRYHRYNNPARQRYYNKVVRKRNPVKADQNHFYHSKEWKEMRKMVFKRDYHLCQYCKSRGVVKQGSVVDHILPVERFPEKMRDIHNMVTCCNSCHYWKTRFEEQYYGTGLHGKPTGNPPLKDISLIAKLSGEIKNKDA